MEIKSINQFQLGDCIGKGAFGSVYRALNLENGEVVAIKQLKLNKISKSELDVIMTEIDLLKKLKHPNIVKYYGFIKTKDFLNIILEYCENGSLQTIYKRFGQFPENLVAVYISQVLDGLLYLHEQGVIHRDIKGPNILTTKDGSAKLADFGVATCMGENADKSVVGSPYWMAPEVIELNGATTASDIWSVGCTTIELLSGEPPYYNLSPMSALFRIVEDEHPPIMEGISSALKDFLLQCFQKDYNLRISAKKLLKHPWIQNARKKLNSDVENIGGWDEQIKSVKKWNEALTDIDKNPVVLELPQQNNSDRPVPDPKINNLLEPEKDDENWDEDFQYESIGNTEFINKLQIPQILNQKINNNDTNSKMDKDNNNKEITIRPKSKLSIGETEPTLKASSISLYSCKEGVLENWEDDFDMEDEESKLCDSSAASFTITPGNYKNLKKSDDIKKQLFEKKKNESDNKGNKCKLSFNMYVEDESDDNDFEDISWTEQDDLNLQKIKTTKGFVFSTADDEDEDDPFSDICEEFNEIELEKNIQKEKIAKLTAEIKQHIVSLSSTNLDVFTNSTQKLKLLFTEQPDLTNVLITNHFILPIIDVLEKSKSSNTITEILELVKIISLKNNEFQEHFILLGGLPLIISYAEMQYEHNIRYLASFIIQTICKNTKSVTFQTFISCRGLPALVELLGGDYLENKDLIFMTIDSIYDIFELQNSTPKSDYLQLFIKCDLIPSLLRVLNHIILDKDIFDAEEYENKIVNIFLKFSRGDAAIKEAVATKEAIRCLLKEIDKLCLRQSINILKGLKNLSSDSSTLDNLFNAGIIPKLIKFINTYKDDEKQYQEISNQVLNIIYNLCRINKNRQESAAKAGVVPILQEYVNNPSPLKEFALPVLCEMVHAGKATRTILWENDVLSSYILLMKDTFWQINAIDAIFAWLLEDPCPIESVLEKEENIEIIINAINLCCSTNSKFDTKFVNFLEILQKLMFISKPITERITIFTLDQFDTLGVQFFGILIGKLLHPNALVKVNILKIFTSMFESLEHEKRKELYVKLNNNYDILLKLDSLMNDSAILVKDLVTSLKKNLDEYI
ncbi:Pkinase-domain-containing protein [Anaeromyces robustus]|uniref:non-specific serine/threonine protein kinase n=1 Tax=Anaeromyces robustus TaxID=1754192 RepID=A0A1Y1X7N2_9FUNG|nr:Pkinase-domain-containing protein [Anaeromyces robustus]|eukprot:ORX81745.1 Pkinase-domain-containing protein [Anaeromyces robustus]